MQPQGVLQLMRNWNVTRVGLNIPDDAAMVLATPMSTRKLIRTAGAARAMGRAGMVAMATVTPATGGGVATAIPVTGNTAIRRFTRLMKLPRIDATLLRVTLP